MSDKTEENISTPVTDPSIGSVVSTSSSTGVADAARPDLSADKAAWLDSILNEFMAGLQDVTDSDPAAGRDPVTFLENMINGNSALSVNAGSDGVTPVPVRTPTQTSETMTTKDALNEVQTLVETQDPAAETEEFVEFVDLLRSDIANNTTFLSSSTGFRAFDFNFDLTRNGLSSDFSELRKADTGLSSGGGLQSSSSSSSSSSSTAVADNGGAAVPSSETQPNNDTPSTPPPIKPDLFTAGNNTIDFNTVVLNNYTNNGVYDARGGDDIITLPDVANAVAHGFVIGTAFLAGLGNDQVTGGDGNDLIYGNAGNDVLIGAGGNDSLLGGDGADTLTGGDGSDVLSGDVGNDILDGGDGNDSLLGGTGNDTLTGGLGNDVVDGGANDDLIIIGTGSDAATGGTGSDTFQFANSTGVDTIADMETGVDTIDISALLTGWNSILHTGFFRIVDNGGNADLEIDADGGGDGFVQIATLTGVNLSAGVDLTDIYGGVLSNIFTGNADAINFNNMEVDWYVDGTENNAGAGNDVVTLADGANEAAAGYNNGSTFYGEAGDDIIVGGDQNDNIDGGTDDDILTGNAGDDVLTAGDGADSLIGGVGNDTYVLNADGAVDRIIYTGASDLTGSAVDTITVFQTGEDIVDISSLLVNWNSLNYADFFRIVDNGGDADLEIDTNGAANGSAYVKIATLVGVNLGAGVELTDIYGGAPTNLFTGGNDIKDLNNMDANWYAAGSQYNAGAGNDIITLANIANAASSGFVIGTSFDAGSGDDLVTGGDGNDVILGNAGNDILRGGRGSDTLDGGLGVDKFTYTSDDLVGGGIDTINNFVAGTDKINVTDLAPNYNSGSPEDSLQLVNSGSDVLVQICVAGDAGTWVTVATVTNVQVGAGISTSDILIGTPLFTDGDETVDLNVITAADFSDGTQYNAGAGNDTIYFRSNAAMDADGFSSTQAYHGGEGNDILYALYGAVAYDMHLYGDAGNDSISGGQGGDYLYGGTGDDVLNGYTGNDYMDGGDGNDTISANTGNKTVFGGDGNDNINMAYGSNYIDGGAGDDIILAANSLGGAQTIIGGSGFDTMTARSYSDTFVWRAADLDGSVDTIAGFDYTEDYLDISGALVAYDGTQADYVRFVDNGADTVMEIDRDGSAGVYGWEEVTTLTGVTFAGGDVSLSDVIFGDIYATLFNDNAQNVDFNTINSASYIDGTQYNAGMGNDVVILPTLANEAGSGFVIGTAFYAGGGDDIVTGGDGDDIIFGGTGDDILHGGLGADTLDGGTGNDVFKIFADDLAGGDVDVINSFTTGGDIIDLSDIWANYDAGNPQNFWRITDNGADATVQISLGGNGSGWVDIINVTGVNLGAGIEASDIFVGNVLFDGDHNFYTMTDITSGTYLEGTQYDMGAGNDTLYFISNAAMNAAGFDYTQDIHGGEGNDILYAQYGAMTYSLNLYGDAGNDSLTGGAGGDYIYGGTGDDVLNGYTGNDYMDGGDGNDTISASTGNKTVFGGDGDDNINILYGSNYIDGGAGDDIIVAANSYGGAQTIIGGSGSDTMTARIYSDTFVWRAADLDGSVDTIAGFDYTEDYLDISGTLVAYDGTKADYVRFVDNGADTVMEIDRDGSGLTYDWEQVTTLTGVTLAGGDVSLSDVIFGDIYATLFNDNAQNVDFNTINSASYIDGTQYNAGMGNDVVILPTLANEAGSGFVIGTAFYAGGGDDIVTGGDGDDIIFGGSGDDILHGGAGDDTLDGGTGSDSFTYELGDLAGNSVDVINNFVTGSDTINLSGLWDDYNAGNASDFWQIVDSGSDALVQVSLDGSASDWITIATVTGVNLGAGIETSDIGAGIVLFDSGHNVYSMSDITAGTYIDGTQYDMGAGNDQLNFISNAAMNAAGFDYTQDIHGGEGNDILYAQYGAMTYSLNLYGDAGNDSLTGGAGGDYIYGGTGDDVLNGYTGNDYLYGGSGNDIISASTGNKTVFGGDGDDNINMPYGSNYIDGGAGDDIIVAASSYGGAQTIIGGSGSDTMTARIYSDTFIWRAADLDGSVDTIAGFDYTEDYLDISGTLVAYDGTKADYVRFVDNGADTVMEIDRDGSAGVYGWEEVTTLTGVTLAGGGVSLDDVMFGQVYADLFDGSRQTVDFNNINASSFTPGTQYDAGMGNDQVVLPDLANESLSGFVIGTAFNAGGGDDIVLGGDGDDLINGGSGNDIIRGAVGNDTLDGGTGDDIFQYELGDLANNSVDLIQNFTTGGDKFDLSALWDDYNAGNASDFWKIVDSGSDALVQISLDGSASDWVTIATVTGVNLGAGIETSDIFVGVSLFNSDHNSYTSSNIVSGTYLDGTQYNFGAGNDSFTFVNPTALTTAGFDINAEFHGGAGDDTFSHGGYNSTIRVYGDDGNDTVNTYTGNDIIYLGAGNDTTYSYTGNDYIDGGAGDDYLSAAAGWQSIFGGAGNDTIVFIQGSGYADGGDGDDIITTANSSGFFNTIVGGKGADTMTAKQYYDTFVWYSDHLDGSVDTIITFDTLEDVLDVSHLMVQFNGTVASYVRFVDNGSDTVLEVDRDGAGGVYDWEEVATLTNVTLAGGGVSLNDVVTGDVVANAFTANNDSINFNFLEAGGYIAASQYFSDTGDDYVVLPDIEFATRAGFVIGTAFNAGAGDDIVMGGDGADVINAGAGDDILRGGVGNDTLDGGTGDDVFQYKLGDLANNSVDVINNFNSGGDKIRLTNIWDSYDSGNASDFWQIVNSGADALVQVSLDGSGSDWITVATVTGVNLGSGIETTDIQAGISLFSDGHDQINFTTVTAGDYVDGTQYDAGDGKDIVTIGTNAQMATSGFSNTTDFHLGGGDDIVSTSSGYTLSLTLYGDEGNDSLSAGAGADAVYGGDGEDYLYGYTGNDYIDGGAGNDFLNAASGHNSLFGREGNDIISPIQGSGYLDGGEGDDVITAANSSSLFNTIVGGKGADTMTAKQYYDTFVWYSDHLDGSVDTIITFDTLEDVLDVSHLMVQFNGTVASYVRFVDNGSDTVLEVDRDGAGGVYDWEEVATLTNVTLAGGGVSLNDVFAGDVVANAFTANNDSINFNFLEAGEYLAASQYAAGAGDDYIRLVDQEFESRSGFVIGTAFDGGDGDDVIHGGDGDDVINGGADNDTLFGGIGDDTMDGGTGNDIFSYELNHLAGGATDLILNFETGSDKINLMNLWNSYNAGQAGNFWQIVDSGADALIQVSLDGDGSNWTTIAVVDGVNLGAGIETTDIQAGISLFSDWHDQINFTTVTAGDYVDGTQYDAGDGKDIVMIGTDAQMATAGFSNSTDFHLGEGDDILTSAAGYTSSLTLYGDEGNDYISAGAGADLIYGGEGEDYLSGYTGNDTIYGGDGNDLLFGVQNTNELYGEAGNDIISGGSNTDLIVGGTGSDIMSGSGGTDTFKWNAGDFDNAELDKITDFADGTEMLDLTNLLVGYSGPGDFADFINIISNGSGGTMVQLDLDGTANGVNFQDFVNITNVADTNITAADFIMS